MTEFHKNWSKLTEKGVMSKSSINGESIGVSGLSRELSIRMAQSLMLHLEMLAESPRPSKYSMGQLLYEIGLAGDDKPLYFEARPADRNCAVRIEEEPGKTYSIHADVRNDYEDFPELGGAMKLQEKFIDSVEALEL